MIPTEAIEVLTYWFGELSETKPIDESKRKTWFSKSKTIDDEIRSRFGARIEEAKSSKLDHWRKTPEGSLALVILLDQFSRNVFRDQAEAFAQDHIALEIAREAIDNDYDQQLFPVQRAFLYMPFMHCEKLSLQAEGLRLFKELADFSEPPIQAMAESFHEYMIKHMDIIEKFGRYPHRNTILGRTSTTEELEFLQTKGSSF